MKRIRCIIAGAGNRGRCYAEYIKKHPESAEIVGIAEPRDYYRSSMAKEFSIPANRVATDWKEIARQEKFADAVLICTQDSMHVEPVLAFAKKGYHILLEKPMAQTEADCRLIVKSVKQNNVIFAVCHVLRYTSYTQKLKEIITSGSIGDIVSIQHLEPVGWWHHAHSFVRGSWRNEKESTFMLMAKSCHDIDWICYIMGRRCMHVSSFGGLMHFRKSNKPKGTGTRCLTCSVESNCPYSARKIYIGRVIAGHCEWPVDTLVSDPTIESVTKALESGPYGRCVYECDNDVVDHQVVNMEFEGGASASFTMMPFTKQGHRITNIFGTRGHIYCDGESIKHFDFLTETTQCVQFLDKEGSIVDGHGGGDYGLMKAFLAAVAENNPEKVVSGTENTLETHCIVFAAERARHDKAVIALNTL